MGGNKLDQQASAVDVTSTAKLSPRFVYLVGLSEEVVPGAALVDDVSDQVLLPVVGGEDADAVGRVAQQTHVHEQSHGIFGLCQVLCVERERQVKIVKDASVEDNCCFELPSCFEDSFFFFF